MSAPVKPDADDDVATEAVLVSEVIPATRERIFAAWMNSDQHSAFTGDKAVIDPIVGGLHSSFDGYASGTTMSLEPFRRIVQTWRATDFPKACPDSLLEITLEETVGGTLLTLLHTEIPTGQSDRYRDAWLQFYLEPLKRYFTGRVPNGVHPADQKALAGPPRKATASARPAMTRTAGPKRKATGRARPAVKAAAGGKTRLPASKPRKKPAAKATAARASGKAVRKAAKSPGVKIATKAAGKAAKRLPAPRKRAQPTRRGPKPPAKSKSTAKSKKPPRR